MEPFLTISQTEQTWSSHLFLTGKVDIPELAPPERLSNVKICQRPSLLPFVLTLGSSIVLAHKLVNNKVRNTSSTPPYHEHSHPSPFEVIAMNDM